MASDLSGMRGLVGHEVTLLGVGVEGLSRLSWSSNDEMTEWLEGLSRSLVVLQCCIAAPTARYGMVQQ